MKLKLVLLALLLFSKLFSQVPDNAQDISPLLIGESIPEAMLLDSEGTEFSLNSIIKEQQTVLIFYRGGWCPYCNSHLAALSEVEEEIIKLGYQIVAISPDHYEMLKTTEATEKLNYKLYSDKDAKLIQDIGIGFKTPERAKGYIFKKTNKDASDVLPVPAVMILDLKGNILFEYINPEYSTRLNAEVLMANLKVLKL